MTAAAAGRRFPITMMRFNLALMALLAREIRVKTRFMRMGETDQQSVTGAEETAGLAAWYLLFALQAIMAVQLGALLLQGQWLKCFLVLAVMAVTIIPFLANRQFSLRIPSELQMLGIAFLFAALFLGEIRDYYERIWWWDIALHVSSGLLLGIIGFLLVYVLNNDARAERHMRPRFIALFAFAFAVACGALWEMFEFGMDQAFGMQMQKPTPNDPSGLTDTMSDMVVDGIGALAISLYGYWHMVRRERFFVDRFIRTIHIRKEKRRPSAHL